MESETDFLEAVLKRSPKDVRILEVVSDHYYRDNRHRESLRLDRKIVRLRPSCPKAHYNLACSLALLGKKSDAVNALHEALSHGFKDFKWLQSDQDFDSIRNYRPFIDLLETYLNN
ncbi:MAG: hypothetical protein ACFCU4_06190 [Puniceicoccaceae bacterium]